MHMFNAWIVPGRSMGKLMCLNLRVCIHLYKVRLDFASVPKAFLQLCLPAHTWQHQVPNTIHYSSNWKVEIYHLLYDRSIWLESFFLFPSPNTQNVGHEATSMVAGKEPARATVLLLQLYVTAQGLQWDPQLTGGRLWWPALTSISFWLKIHDLHPRKKKK